MRSVHRFVLLVAAVAIFPFLSTDVHSASVVKSPNDSREYHAFTLKNRLDAIVISDPDARVAAAALSVGVGFFQDPIDRPGLAHFLEHMLFLGNGKYPKPGDFGRFVSAHGGSGNAQTGGENTTYFFSIRSEYLREALDRFAHFFISPTLDPEFVDKEVNAVHSEYQKSKRNDAVRMHRVIRATANPMHPFSKFGMGNRQTLQGNAVEAGTLRSALKRFHLKYYSANLMKLVVLGRESTEVLESRVRELFSQIEDRNVSIPDAGGKAIDAQLPRRIRIKPIKNANRLRLMFPIPSLLRYYRFKPEQVISSLLGDEGKGSLLSYLKRKEWVANLSTGTGIGRRGFGFFQIDMELTDRGAHHTDDIVEAFFTYLKLIREDKNRQRYYRELKKLAEIQFRFQEKERPFWYVRRLAAALHTIPARDAVAGAWLYERYRPDLEEDLLKRLTPDNLQLVVVGKDAKRTRTERWYRAEYAVERVNVQQIGRWKEPKSDGGFALPPPNRFIPDRIRLKVAEVETEYPRLLIERDNLAVWFKHDDVFNVPKGNLRIVLSTPKAYASPKEAAMSRLFVDVLQESLNEYAYPASVAGLRYSLYNTVRGIVLSMGGYAEKMEVLLRKVLDGFGSFAVSPARFETYKERMKDRRKNQKLAAAHRRASYESVYFLSETLWHYDEYLKVIDGITISDVKAFVPELLARIDIEMLAHGNFSRKEVRGFGSMLEERFLRSDGRRNGRIEEKAMKIAAGSNRTYAFPVEDINSAVQVYFQAGPENREETVLLDLLGILVEKPFYHRLRTLEQLGYLVSSSVYSIHKVNGFSFLIQSGQKDPLYLQSRIDHFLREFEKRLIRLSAEEFDQYRNTAIGKRLEESENLHEETERLWSVIASRSYDFSYRQREIEALRSVDRARLLSFYRSLFLSPKASRRVNFQAWGSNHGQPKSSGPHTILNPRKWKGSSEYYDNPDGRIRRKKGETPQ